jgi:large subunit ribosomal protein L21
MYAVVRIQGVQHRVEPDVTVRVPRLEAAVGDRLQLDEVLAVGDEGKLRVGRPLVEGARVEAEVLGHVRGPKVRGFKYKRRKDYRRTFGHRTDYTELRIHGVEAGSGSAGDTHSTAAAETAENESGSEESTS